MLTAEFGRSILPEIENEISGCDKILSSSSRSDPLRPGRLRYLASLRTIRYDVLGQEEDINKCISRITEAILLPKGPFQSSQDMVYGFSLLASCLLSRFSLYKRPKDIKYSLEYFRYLRGKFRPFGAFHLPSDRLTSNHVRALAHHVMLSNDVVKEMEEMADLSLELLTSGILTGSTRDAIFDFSIAAVTIFRRDDEMQPPERVIDSLRFVAEKEPHFHHVSFALAHCLAIRFQTTESIELYEEAMTRADKIIAPCSHGDKISPTQKRTIELILVLMTDRLNFCARPEYLLDSIYRLHILHDIPSLPDRLISSITKLLNGLRQRHLDYFGVDYRGSRRNSVEAHRNTSVPVHSFSSSLARARFGSTVEPADNVESETESRAVLLKESLSAIRNNEPTIIEETVKYGRILVPSQQSSRRSPISPINDLAEFLFESYRHTSRLDHLNEAIITLRRILYVPGTNRIRVQVAEDLLNILDERWRLFCGKPDFEEIMLLFARLVSTASETAFHRFPISCRWASKARDNGHPCTSDAYENAMSLMQDTLIFSPTLQTQHSRLFETVREFEGMPLDYASYQVETKNLKQAAQTLERGRGLLWSEMRGFRPSTDQLRAVHPCLADRFAAVNRDLETVTMSVAENENSEILGGEARNHQGMHSFGQLLFRHRRLMEERDILIAHIQSFEAFENFLKPPSFDTLNSAAAHGPVILVNHSKWRSDVIILHKDLPPSLIPTPSNFHDRANNLKDELLRVRREQGLDSKDYGLTLASVLSGLYELVGKPVIERLSELKLPEKSRVWWCPTGAFCSLPLHAMGPIPSDDGNVQYFSDQYIPSYTPTLSALIESRKRGSLSETVDDLKPSILLVAQPETLPGAFGEITTIERTKTLVTTLVSAMATPETVVEGLRNHRFAHFVCHGLLETGKPFDASLQLHKDNLSLLAIVRSQLPAAELAFLSACHTAELTEGSLADEGLHLAAAMQYCGFRSVVGTMWAMADTDGEDLSKCFYRTIFLDRAYQNGVPYHERSARALQMAVKKLRRKRGITLERWVNFVHYGA
ncbi:CHAT domain containing protein [Lactarius tabidus]